MTVLPSLVWADFVLEEVVVTAQKREQNLQDVGITVTALDHEAMSRAGIQDISRIELVTPGVSYGFIGSDAKIAIRGANSNNTFADNSSIAGFFADGVYRPRASQQSQAYFDVARLEILKGPQGTLYGRNTFAGAINLHTNAPNTEAVGGGVDVSVARFDKVRTEGYINAPVNDNFALRFAGVIETSDGWIRNSGSGGRLGIDDDAHFRISALWTPTDNVEVIARYTSINEKGTTPGIFAAEGLCRPVDASGLTDAFGRFEDCQNPAPGSAGVDSAFNEPNEVNYDVRNDRDNSEDNVTLEVNWELGSVALKSISSYTDFESAFAFDGDFSGNPGYPYYWDDAAESYTQELQLSSAGEGFLKWTTGLYYSVDEISFGFSQFRTATYADRTETATDLNGVELEVLSGTALIDPFGRGNFSDFADFQEIETTTEGVFFQGEASVTDTLRLIAGIRWNKEEKETDTFSGASVPGTGQFGLNARPIDVFVYTLRPERSATRRFEDTTWRAGFEWDVNDSILLYVNASTGFLSGGVNSDGSAFESQESQAYEAGIKSRWLDDSVQLNAAFYINEFTNLTTQELIVLDGASITRTVNGGEVDTTGLEV
ncbi:MAG: TonB-dependent receptor, partial [Pseudomonadales bacterium]